MNEVQITSRLVALRRLLVQAELSSQEDLRDSLKRQGFKVTQATVSRDLRKLGAIRVLATGGKTAYRLNESAPESAQPRSLRELVVDIQANDSMIVIHTTLGSASLVARHLDLTKPGGIIGTIAGDDTIFVAPPLRVKPAALVRTIEESL